MILRRLSASFSHQDWFTVLVAYRMTEIMRIPPGRATWDQIVSSGHLELLPTEVLGAGLVGYYANSEADTTYGVLQDSRYVINIHM